MRADLMLTTSTPGDPGQALPAMLMVLGVLMLGMVLMLSIRRRVVRRQAAMRPPRERLDRVKAEARRRDDAHALEARLLDTSQRLAAQLDTKAARLEQLIARADERLAALMPAVEASPIPTIRPEPPEPPPEPPPKPPPERAPEPAPVPAGVARDPISAAVYRLADDGRDVVDIARELDEQIGKVELILALRGDRDA